MPPPSAPDIGMLMGIAVSGRCLNSVNHLLPGLEAASLESVGAQRFPPGFNQVQVCGVLGLIDEFPTRMMQHEEQQIIAVMDIQMAHPQNK